MYSRYSSCEPYERPLYGHHTAHTHQPVREAPPEPAEPRAHAKPKREGRSSGFLGLGGLLRNLKIDWDMGDILLILIILLLSAEGDDTELIIILALVLVMGL